MPSPSSESESPTAPLLRVEDLCVTFRALGREPVEAAQAVSFSLEEGRTLAIVGESGSGKSVTALSLTRLLPPPPQCVVSGRVSFAGRDVLSMPPRALRALRGKEIAYVFQEPSTSLNPVFSVGDQIAEAIRLHLPGERAVTERVIAALQTVGIRDPEQRHRAYPHELSGGMQQRVMIAMALACEPRLLVADEPTTALDVTIQKQIMDLLAALRTRRKMSILLITHNFGIVKDFADEVLVMYRGRIVEHGPTSRILNSPRHPYTQALIGCVPRLGVRSERLTVIDHAALAGHSPAP